jgi:hypothetical protein
MGFGEVLKEAIDLAENGFSRGRFAGARLYSPAG